MKDLLIAFAVAALAVAIAPVAEAGAAGAAASSLGQSAGTPLVQLAECEDECQDYMEAREQVQEARQDAARDAAEVREEFAPQRAFERDAPSASRRASAVKDDKPTAKTATNPVATAKTDSTDKSAKITTADTSEPKTVQKIVEKAMGVETSADTETPAKSSSPKGCKQYFAAIGMTLSVPCDK